MRSHANLAQSMVEVLGLVGLWLISVAALIVSIASAPIVGVGTWVLRGTAVLGVGLAVPSALALWSNIGWQNGWILALPVALLIVSICLIGIMAHAVQVRSAWLVDSVNVVANQESSDQIVQQVRRTGLKTDSDYWPGSEHIDAGPNKKHALYIFIVISCLLMGTIGQSGEGTWPSGILFSLAVGLLGMLLYLAVTPVHNGWAIRREQILQSPNLRESLESRFASGWLMRFLVRRWCSKKDP